MNYKALLSVVVGLGVVAGASAQLNIDRNFQRVDKPAKAGPGIAGAGPSRTWQIAGMYTFPDTMKSYGGALIFTDVSKDGLFKMFQSTTSYSKNDPSGGTKSDTVSETMSMQLTSDEDYAITPGWTYAYTNNGTEATMPFIGGTYMLMNGAWGFTPTLTYAHFTIGGVANNGYIPDFMLMGSVPSLMSGQSLTLYADYTVATRVAGTGSVQVGGKHSLTKDLSFKGAATFSKGSQPGFLAQLSYTFSTK